MRRVLIVAAALTMAGCMVRTTSGPAKPDDRERTKVARDDRSADGPRVRDHRGGGDDKSGPRVRDHRDRDDDRDHRDRDDRDHRDRDHRDRDHRDRGDDRDDMAEREGPVECRGNQSLEIRGERIVSTGDGIVARGNCSITIRSSVIEAGGTGIDARGNVSVEIVDSEVRGDNGSADLRGNVTIVAEGSTFSGRPSARGNASFEDRGGNSFR